MIGKEERKKTKTKTKKVKNNKIIKNLKFDFLNKKLKY